MPRKFITNLLTSPDIGNSARLSEKQILHWGIMSNEIEARKTSSILMLYDIKYNVV